MTVENLKDLSGLTEEHIGILESKGIKTPADMKKALADDEKVKDIVGSLKGVGPKTISKWKDELSAEAKAEPAKTKEVAVKEETKPAAKEDDKKVEVVEQTATKKAYVPNAKPELDKETVGELAKRAVISGRRPAFKRQEWFRYKKLDTDSWRRPKGIHSKMKRNLKRRAPVVDIGFRGPTTVRNLHPSGFEEVLVNNIDGLEGIDPKKQAVRIGRTVGTKKRVTIQERAEQLGIRVLNRMV